MDRLASLCIAAALGFGAFVGTSSADAMTMKDCSAKYKAAQAANSLNGMKWNDFRKAQCGTDAAEATPAKPTPKDEPTAANTENASEPAPTKVAAPKGVVFPTKVAAQYANETPGKGRMHTCLDQYKLDKTNNSLNGLTWIKKGGGYYSICNSKLKS
ncbi:hypothetical protein [Rhizobium leguminosarum]|uniref:Uncharacterized protein n=1 Tax=Rhizobium leguminosarum TaxID=384 RepID=A0ABD7PJZ5_RHILE|nr:hypothetical protein [Rhizobium leguminosarum]TAV64735.1 hypothetical protein ELI28_28195 [Rhizobium leguminosarum]TAV65193.1 hypothetical protein ELI27_30730 [Rhizobium leguminosarum]TAW25182.1 hypothetical protein ELI19_27440 [Rhizobium leguminosarum]TAW38953.1 hypothetical protein ELI18_27410 [Rhizobium leguminosarum]TAZ25289.1 hypothetical protein ELH73_29655 [Rhizobium leguminosarum]